MAATLLLAIASPVKARITNTKPNPSETFSPLLPLTLSAGFEYETNSQQTDYDFPLILEYAFSEQLQLTIETNFDIIDSNTRDMKSVNGFGDLETSLQYEFLRERRYTPAISAEGIIKWPTASNSDIGDPGTDYGIGLIASKDFVVFDLDMEVIYTFTGDTGRPDNFEVSVSAEYPLNHYLDLIGEVAFNTDLGSGGDGSEIEGTLGFAWHINERLKFEAGGVVRDDGTWQIVTALEWSFAGD